MVKNIHKIDEISLTLNLIIMHALGCPCEKLMINGEKVESWSIKVNYGIVIIIWRK